MDRDRPRRRDDGSTDQGSAACFSGTQIVSRQTGSGICPFWVDAVSLFPRADSWYFGVNIPAKPREMLSSAVVCRHTWQNAGKAPSEGTNDSRQSVEFRLSRFRNRAGESPRARAKARLKANSDL